MRMKTRYIAMMLSCALLSACMAAPAVDTPAIAQEALSPAAITAQAAILIDAKTGRVLFEKNADEKKAPASTTKLMTLLLALEKGSVDQMIVVPDSAGKAPADSTRVPVYPGEKMPLRDLLYGLMIKSGNDAANAIGTLVSGSVDGFVAEMNARARQLGLKNTQFVNPHGYPEPGHLSTARDLATLTRHGLERAAFREMLFDRQHTMQKTNLRPAITLSNHYAILDPDSQYYSPYAKGGKTGYAALAGQCFVCVGEKDGNTLISVVLNAGSTKPPKWIDTKVMLDYGFDALRA